MKVIFIPVSDRPECVAALHQGFTMGQTVNASVIGCHIRPHSKEQINLPNELTEKLYLPDSYELAWEKALADKHTLDSHTRALQLFEKMANNYNYPLSKHAKSDPVAMWIEKVGSPAHLFSILGPTTDLIVVSRPKKKGHSMSKIIMNAAILNASTPVLILPQKKIKTIGRNVAIAWNQSSEASLAVKAAMPILSKAQKVTIITTGIENKLGPKSTHLKQYLSHWGINSSHVKAKKGNENAAILDAYKQSNSDMLVMGGYSRSRLRQLIFGGVTEHMLSSANIPVFMLHN